MPDHPLPDGLEIRPVRDEDIRTIWEADVEAFRDHWGFVEQSEEDYERFVAFPYHDPTLWKIAWDDEGVAGQVKSFIDTAQNEAHGRQRGWTEAISTSRRWRRRGVAKAFIVESIRELAARGMTEVALGVHTENPNGAYALYAEPRLRGRQDLDDVPQAALSYAGGTKSHAGTSKTPNSTTSMPAVVASWSRIAPRDARARSSSAARVPERDEPCRVRVVVDEHEGSAVALVLAEPRAEVLVAHAGDLGDGGHGARELRHGRNHRAEGYSEVMRPALSTGLM